MSLFTTCLLQNKYLQLPHFIIQIHIQISNRVESRIGRLQPTNSLTYHSSMSRKPLFRDFRAPIRYALTRLPLANRPLGNRFPFARRHSDYFRSAARNARASASIIQEDRRAGSKPGSSLTRDRPRLKAAIPSLSLSLSLFLKRSFRSSKLQRIK